MGRMGGPALAVATLATLAVLGVMVWQVAGSSLGAEYLRVRRPRRLGGVPARRPEQPPAPRTENT